jgi:hypothetical protein
VHYTLGDQLLDLAENSVEAGAARVEVLWEETDAWVRLKVQDDGRGMTRDQLARATDPFYTDGTKHVDRKIGLGLAFLTQTADATGGSCTVRSEPGSGTVVEIALPAGHVDLPPGGDPVETVGLLLCLADAEIVVERRSVLGGYRVSKRELESVLDDLDTVEGRLLLRQFLQSQEDELWQR